MISVAHLLRYPIKSCRGEFLNTSIITHKGLLHDRNWALFDKEGQVITGRQHSQMLDIEVHISEEIATVLLDKRPQISFPLKGDHSNGKEAKVFSYDVKGLPVNNEIDSWFSDYLEKNVSMLYTSDFKRPVLSKHGGQENDIVSFADQAPILLLSEESIEDLNNRLSLPITFHRFRPNIVVKGVQAYDEDGWKRVQIGECTFDVIQQCERCIFTTIDPKSKMKDRNREPLRTLATYRQKENGGVDFGVHLVPRKLGKIRVEDELIVL